MLYFPALNDRIITLSLQEFLEHGIRTMTMQKLVLPLGISTKTMYKYFRNKEVLLEECLKVHYRNMGAGIHELLMEAPNEVIALSVLYKKIAELDFGTNALFYHDLNYYYPELQDKVIKEFSSGPDKILTSVISKGIGKGYFLAELNPAVVFETLNMLYRSVSRQQAFKQFDLNPLEAINHTVAVYLRGICTEEGLKILNDHKQTTH